MAVTRGKRKHGRSMRGGRKEGRREKRVMKSDIRIIEEVEE